ncbi:MAG: hypothetical protein KC468_17480 [Myxococcales bacterium]|nr:hypothetical protein [Myxococcales bacterium]
MKDDDSTAGPPGFRAPRLINLDNAFCDPVIMRPTLVATFRLRNGTRVEFAVCDAVTVHAGQGPRLEMHQLLVAPPSGRTCSNVSIVQVRDFAEFNGMPEVARALEFHEQGRAKDAARYAMAAGPRWSGLVDYFGGPA